MPDYPPLLEGLNLHVQPHRRIAFTGPNGAGKTTLLRTIAGRIPPLGGRVHLGASVRLGYMAQEQELLDPGVERRGNHPPQCRDERDRSALLLALLPVHRRRASAAQRAAQLSASAPA